jgi:hypothetical protein
MVGAVLTMKGPFSLEKQAQGIGCSNALYSAGREATAYAAEYFSAIH